MLFPYKSGECQALGSEMSGANRVQARYMLCCVF
jgi:hypothetical protein